MARQALKPEQKIVLDMAHHFGNQLNVNTMQMACDMANVSMDVVGHQRMAELCFNYIGLLAERAESAGPNHPLSNEYQTAKKMVEGLFEIVNRGGKHRTPGE